MLVLIALASCRPRDGEGTDAAVAVDAGPTLDLVPGVVPVACTPARDATIDGDRVIILARERYVDEEVFDATLCISDDRAATFRTVTVPQSELGELETYAIHTAASRTWLVLADRVLGGTLARARSVLAAEVDLGTGLLGDPIVLDETPLVTDAGAMHFGSDGLVYFSRSHVAEPDRHVRFVRVDAATGSVTRTDAPAPGGDCAEPPLGRPFLSTDGETFSRACYRGTDFCVQRATATGPSFEELCTDYHDWTIPWRDAQEDIVIGGELRRIWNDRGYLRARSLLPTGPAPALGPESEIGMAVTFAPGVRAFRDVLVLGSGAPPALHGRFATMTGGVLTPLAIPPLPCVESAECPAPGRPYEAVTLVAPMGAGAWLVLYTWVGGGYALVVREGEGTPPPFDVPADLPEGTGGDHIEMQPADSALEEACALAVSCSAGRAMHPWSCVEYWTRIRGVDATGDAAYQRFIATPRGDCAALEGTFPGRFGDCTARCLPDGRSISCTDREMTLLDTFFEVRDCPAEGATCVVTGTSAGCTLAGTSCNTCDASGHAVRCAAGDVPDEVIDCTARGLSCWPGGDAATTGCRPDPIVAADFSWCEGNTFVRYGAAGIVTAHDDCSRAHMACRQGSGCQPIDRTSGTPCLPTPTECDGTRMRWSICRYTRFVDCLDLGGSGCDAGRCTFP